MSWFTKYRPTFRSVTAFMDPFHPLWIFLFFGLVPPAIVGLIYGGIPVFDPDTDDFDQKLPYIVLQLVYWFAILELRAQRCELAKLFIAPVLCTFFIPAVVMLLIVPWTNPFPAIGMIPYAVAVGVFMLSLFVFRRLYSSCTCDFYPAKRWAMIKMILLTEFTFCLFVAYTLVYRQIPGSYQKLMTAVWVFALLFIKKGALTVTDEAPYELAMLYSGFSLQSLSDTFFTFVYPAIQDPKTTFLVIFFIISGSDYLYLLFLVKPWFPLRVWIKGRLKAIFCCRRFPRELHQPIKDDLYADDRGQTDMKPGYYRRQIQFFYYRTLSGIFAQLWFLISTPIFRYWTNRDWYPFSLNSPAGFSSQFKPLPEDSYRNACIYALARLGTLLLLVPFSFWIIRRWLAPDALSQCIDMYRRLLTSKRFILYIAVSLLASELLCAWMCLLHNEIWFIDTLATSTPPPSSP